MRLLLDTHVLIWWIGTPGKLSSAAHEAVSDAASAVHVSAASAWEVATKLRLGRLQEEAAAELVANFQAIVAGQRFRVLPIDHDDAILAGSLPMAHGDPFDRMLAAQSLRRDLVLVSIDAALDQSTCRRLW